MKRAFLCATAILLPLVAGAERISEKRETASHQLIGQVLTVYRDDGKGDYTNFIVKIRIETMEMGPGYKARDFIYVSCFRRNKNASRLPGASGHGDPPPVGARVRAFINQRNGANEGVYPDWFDVLKDNKERR